MIKVGNVPPFLLPKKTTRAVAAEVEKINFILDMTNKL